MIAECPTETLNRRSAVQEKQRQTVIDLGQNKMHKTCELEDTTYLRSVLLAPISGRCTLLPC